MDGRKGYWIVLGLALGYSGAARAQEPGNQDDVNARLERQEKKIQELMETVKKLQSSPASPPAALPTGTSSLNENDVQKIVGDYLKTVEQKKAEEVGVAGQTKGGAAPVPATQTEEGYRVGSDLSIKAKWDYGLYFYTPNNDFSMHVGYWVQYDNVFWDQSNLLRLPQGPNAGLSRPGNPQKIISGAPLGGINNLEDGTYFRRVRPLLEGTFWEIGEYRFNLALENIQQSTTGLDEFWVAINKIPVIGTARIGHVKNQTGLEADMTASSRCMTFMERSSYSEAIELNQNFVTGLLLGNSFLDDRTSYQYVLARADNGASSTFFGDGQYLMSGRLTALPIWDQQARSFLHLGVSGSFRTLANVAGPNTFKTLQIRARPELRDDDPAGGAGGDANSNRMIDTGAVVANHDFIAGLEALYVLGPFSVQAEYGWNWLDGVRGITNGAVAGGPPAGTVLTTFKGAPKDFVFSGGYVQLAYTLTGESRDYDKKWGTLSRYYFTNKGMLFNNAWLVRDEDGRLNMNTGAWEIAARYSYTNLNDTVGGNRIQGGIMNGFTAGLNWYLNQNIKFQFDYAYDQRAGVPQGGTPPTSTIPGFTSGLGMRVQLSY